VAGRGRVLGVQAADGHGLRAGRGDGLRAGPGQVEHAEVAAERPERRGSRVLGEVEHHDLPGIELRHVRQVRHTGGQRGERDPRSGPHCRSGSRMQHLVDPEPDRLDLTAYDQVRGFAELSHGGVPAQLALDRRRRDAATG